MANKKKTTPAAESAKEAVKPAADIAEVKADAPEATAAEPVKAAEVVPAADKAADKPAKTGRPAKSAAAKADKPAAGTTKAKTEKPVNSKKSETKSSKPSKTVKMPAKTAEKTAKSAEKSTKTSAKAADEKIVLQYEGNNYDMAELSERCKADFKSKNPRKRISSFEIYINLVEKKAYYVVNGAGSNDYNIDL